VVWIMWLKIGQVAGSCEGSFEISGAIKRRRLVGRWIDEWVGR